MIALKVQIYFMQVLMLIVEKSVKKYSLDKSPNVLSILEFMFLSVNEEIYKFNHVTKERIGNNL